MVNAYKYGQSKDVRDFNFKNLYLFDLSLKILFIFNHRHRNFLP